MYLKSSFFVFILSIFMVVNGMSQSNNSSEETMGFPKKIEVNWEVQTNYLDGGNRSRSILTLSNKGSSDLKNSGWSLYFNFLRIINPESLPANVKVTHVNGNLFKLEPTEQFETVKSGEKAVIPFEFQAPATKKIDAPSGFYFVYGNNQVVPVSKVSVAPFLEERQTDRGINDNIAVPTPALLFNENTFLRQLPADSLTYIIPTPVEEVKKEGDFLLHSSVRILHAEELKKEALFLSEIIEELLGIELTVEEIGEEPHLSEAIILQQGNMDQYASEAYKMNIESEQIEITGADPSGVFYGIQSLRALFPTRVTQNANRSVKINTTFIKDAPRFSYRGLHLDVARNFQPVSAVKKLIDVMAYYKLNKFHFHLTDDEGWRLPVEELPELTEVGGRRGHTETEQNYLIPSYGSGPNPDPEVSPGSGWYSREEFIEILQYADKRHIEVIPEINVPGHARAAIVAMKARYEKYMAEGNHEAANQYRLHEPGDRSEYRSVQNWDDNVVNVCQPSTYRFLETVINELISIYADADIPLQRIHAGGDEVPHGAWEESPACTKQIERTDNLNSTGELMDYFFQRLHRMLADRDLTMAGWEEVALNETEGGTSQPDSDLVGKVQPYVWANIWGSGTEGNAYKLANAGYEVVMSQASNFYFDLAYNKHPEEPGLYWAGFVDNSDPYAFIPYDLYKNAESDLMGNPLADTTFSEAVRLTEKGKDNILGLQGQLWGETLINQDRMEYMAVPRLLALAERAWAEQPDWATLENKHRRKEHLLEDWNEFANRLGQRELPRLDNFHGGFHYRLPPPGATIEDGMLKANVVFPGLTIRYTLDGSEPTANSDAYTAPVPVAAASVIKLRTFDTNGRGSRTVAIGDSKD